MNGRQPWIELQGFVDRRSRDRKRIARPHEAVEAEEGVGIGKARVSQRRRRILAQRLFETLPGGQEAALVALAPEKPALQAQMERASIQRGPGSGRGRGLCERTGTRGGAGPLCP